MLAKYFTGRLHICFLTSQKGVGFIEESEILCPCHEHLETSNVSAQVVGGSGVNDRINLDPPEGLSLDPPDAEVLQRTNPRDRDLVAAGSVEATKSEGICRNGAPGGCYIVASCKKRSLQTSAPAMPSQQYGLLTSPKKNNEWVPFVRATTW